MARLDAMEATMNTLTPYSDRWRERTRERCDAVGLRLVALIEQTGLHHLDVSEAVMLGPVSHEVTGPIDELLDRLEAERETEALAELLGGSVVNHPGVGMPRVCRVAVDLGPLTNCDVVLHGREP
jgi:hypothetical protein